jgi:hypothetical protein
MLAEQMQEGATSHVAISEFTERPGQPAGHTMRLLTEGEVAAALAEPEARRMPADAAAFAKRWTI